MMKKDVLIGICTLLSLSFTGAMAYWLTSANRREGGSSSMVGKVAFVPPRISANDESHAGDISSFIEGGATDALPAGNSQDVSLPEVREEEAQAQIPPSLLITEGEIVDAEQLQEPSEIEPDSAKEDVSIIPVLDEPTRPELKVPAIKIDPAMFNEGTPKSFAIAVLSPHPEVSGLVQEGMHHLLLNREDLAGTAFKKAVDMDANCPLAHWGLFMTYSNPGCEGEALAQASLVKIKEWSGDTDLPAKDRAYLEAAVALSENGVGDAGIVFQVIADRWKGDLAARMFASLMLHDRYDTLGQPLRGQKDALTLLDEALETNPDNHALNYLRALMEECAPFVSLQAMECSQKAVNLAPSHATSHHLQGHLMFRSGRYGDAVKAFNQSIACLDLANATDHSENKLKSLLYKHVALFCAGNQEGAYNEALEVSRLTLDDSGTKSPGMMLMNWETVILPAKMVLTSRSPKVWEKGRKSLPKQSDFPIGKNDRPEMILCKAFDKYLKARVELASKQEEKGKKTFVLFQNAQKSYMGAAKKAQNEGALSYWIRGKQLMEQLDLDLRTRLFPDSREQRRISGQSLQGQASLLLPPVLPFPTEYWAADDLYEEPPSEQHKEEQIKWLREGLKRFPNHSPSLNFINQITRQGCLAPLVPISEDKGK